MSVLFFDRFLVVFAVIYTNAVKLLKNGADVYEVVHIESLAYGEIALPITDHPHMFVETYGRIASVDVEFNPVSFGFPITQEPFDEIGHPP